MRGGVFAPKVQKFSLPSLHLFCQCSKCCYYRVDMSSGVETERAPRVFPNTRWSVVLAARQASPEAAAALETICQAYWQPLYAYVRRSGKSPHDAQDLTQEFFY